MYASSVLDPFSRFEAIPAPARERGQTDGYRVTAYTALAVSHGKTGSLMAFTTCATVRKKMIK